ncbi:type II secretion system protein M [Massilia sp. B-10]|nr:type II secretion system protein M [Massilia sp. B-10]
MIGQFKDQLALYWLARTEQERKYLTVGGATLAGVLVYMLFIGPALDGKAKLNKQLPQMRVEAATMQALAQEATELASRPAPAVSPMTRESLTASLTARAMTPSLAADHRRIRENPADRGVVRQPVQLARRPAPRKPDRGGRLVGHRGQPGRAGRRPADAAAEHGRSVPMKRAVLWLLAIALAAALTVLVFLLGGLARLHGRDPDRRPFDSRGCARYAVARLGFHWRRRPACRMAR